MRQRHVLVTGGAGFIGSHMVDRLVAEGFAVTVLDNESTGNCTALNPHTKFILGDVRSENDLTPIFKSGMDAVFHIAGQAAIRLSFLKPEDDLSVNVLGTVNVLK